jgi:type III pantothenate kinase
MMLVLDLGNTNKKVCVYSGGRVLHMEVSDQLSLRTLKEIFEKFPDISSGIVASVVTFPVYLRKFLEERLDRLIELNSRTQVPVKNLYKTPGRLGKDRLAAAVAGSILFSGFPVLVINAGTCLTYDLVTSKNQYLGGAISPGIRMRLNALHTFTEKLPLISINEEAPVLGTDTAGSITSGVINGTVEEVRGMIRLYRQEYQNLQVVLSGGDAEYLDKRLKIRIFAFPNVVLYGLYEILEYNLKHVV